MGKYFSYWRPVGKMSLRDVRKENMTGFWNSQSENKVYSVKKIQCSLSTNA